jgi:hypothetical protein
VANFTVEEKY